MKAIITYMERVDGYLVASARIAEATNKKDMKVTASNLVKQMDARLMDIIYDDNPNWEDYLKSSLLASSS